METTITELDSSVEEEHFFAFHSSYVKKNLHGFWEAWLQIRKSNGDTWIDDGKSIHLGTFPSKKEACDVAKKKLKLIC